MNHIRDSGVSKHATVSYVIHKNCMFYMSITYNCN